MSDNGHRIARTWSWRLSRPLPLASFDTSVFHAYDTDHLAACDPTKTVVESFWPMTDHSPRCETCHTVTVSPQPLLDERAQRQDQEAK